MNFFSGKEIVKFGKFGEFVEGNVCFMLLKLEFYFEV